MIKELQRLARSFRTGDRGAAARLAGASGAAQAIALAVSPVLTRLYSPSDFGYFAVWASATQVLIPLASLRYFHGIVLPRADHDARALTGLCLRLTLLSSVVLWGLLLAAAPSIDGQVPWWALAPVVFVGSAEQTLQKVATRHRRFTLLAWSVATYTVVMVGTQVVLATIGFRGVHALVTGDVAGHVSALTVLVVAQRSDVIGAIRSEPSDRRRLARQHIDFVRYRTWGDLLNGLSIHLTPVLLAAGLGSAAAGQYALAHRVVYGPMKLLGKAIQSVNTQRIAKGVAEGASIAAVHANSRRALDGVGFAVAIVMAATAAVLFEPVFGTEWVPAGQIAAILAVPFAVTVVPSNLSPTLVALRQQRRLSGMQAELLAFDVVPLLVLPMFGGLILTISGYGLAQSVAYWRYRRLIDRAVGGYESQLVTGLTTEVT